MTKNTIDDGKYILPTAAGVYHLACQPGETAASQLFSNILRHKSLDRLSDKDLQRFMNINDTAEFERQITAIHSLGWIEEFDEPLSLPDDALEDILPSLLASLSSSGQALIADNHGFCLFSNGLSVQDSETLAAMTAELSSINERYQSLSGQTVLPTQAWGTVDAAGNSHLGVWPIQVGYQNFNLMIQGLPKLNHPNFVIIVWLLYSHYFSE